MTTVVNVDNFVRAETGRMFRDLQKMAGGVNRFVHNRVPSPIEDQAVIRLNRDTLYSFAIVDLAGGATLTLPEHGERYVSAMVVDEDHYVEAVFHDAGEYELSPSHFASRHVGIAVRILVDPTDPADLDAVAGLQDRVELRTGASEPYVLAEYDTTSLDETRSALLVLARNLSDFDHTFGTKEEVDPVRHLIGTAAGWGGLPSSEATYVGVDPRLPAGQYEITVRDVPVDGFWSISVYNAEGFFVKNDRDSYTINNITAAKNDDGSTTVRFGDHPAAVPNVIPIMEGWNYLVRLYRPRPEVLDGSWQFPSLGS